MDTTKLRNLPVIAGMPDWEQMERYFERPYIADVVDNWLIHPLGPNENQPSYGREIARMGGMAGLMLNSDVPMERKETLLIRLIQNGIDVYGLVEEGRRIYKGDGGHWSGRRWPVFFAGIMLNDEDMIQANQVSIFAEDHQTHYGEGWAGQKALFQNIFHAMPAFPYEHKEPGTWTTVDSREEGSNNQKAEGYRLVNIAAWPATALVVRLMGVVKEWNHDAFIDYCDRIMSAEDPYAEGRKVSTHADERYKVRPTNEGRTQDAWVNDMWKTYRLTAPEPEWAGNNRMWIWTNHIFPGVGEWQDNPKPAEPAETYVAPQ